MKGILFTPEMHLAICKGRKTQTRRLSGLEKVNLKPDLWQLKSWEYVPIEITKDAAKFLHNGGTLAMVKPRYHVGETVFIKEAHYAYGKWHKEAKGWVFQRDEDMAVVIDGATWAHALKGHQGHGWFKRSPLFMPAWAARDFIKMLKIFPQRAQGVTPAQAITEGFESVEAWGAEIDRLNPKEKPWANNLWLFAYCFEKVRA